MSVNTQNPSGKDWLIAALIFAATLALLLGTMEMGFTRDESFYFHAAFKYLGWFEGLWDNLSAGSFASFTQENVDKHWAYNPEHPVLMKSLFALSLKLFHQKLEWMSASTAIRFPGLLSGAALVALVFVWARQLFGRGTGLLAAAFLLFQPRFFFHAHMACFDVPIVALWTAVVYAYWRSLDSNRWALFCGVLWGLALVTKLNAFFLPIVLVGHWVFTNWRGFRIRGGLKIPKIPRALFAMLFIGPVLFFALWPRHWFDTFDRVKWYLEFHLKHVHYFVYYFGKNIQQPPFPISYPWVMTFVTVPATIVASFFVGVVAWWSTQDVPNQFRMGWAAWRTKSERDLPDPRGTGWLLAVNVLFPIALISMPNTPIFGGTKHWMAAMPFVAIVAASGVIWAAQRLGETPLRKHVATIVISLLMVSPAIYGTLHNHPFGTSYYNEFIGSTRGAADSRMMRQFWGYTARQALPWLNENAPKGARVFTHNTTGYAWGTYSRDDMRRKDLRASGLPNSQYALYHHQKAFLHVVTELWDEYDTSAPVHVVALDGVPVLSVYKVNKK